jgi:hypothetical protein
MRAPKKEQGSGRRHSTVSDAEVLFSSQILDFLEPLAGFEPATC